ncbi:hypothetical protein CBOM_00762 [Ceraceosorus bombacis]|uniref:Uncharacterized protein n=1 Tax=Ceraceosorus bombacis TaxID=401625 RepID=A0A0N7L950_9BASI|nr:hypothetical protein CBOM_00762 [Ceraceosorus bombacis]
MKIGRQDETSTRTDKTPQILQLTSPEVVLPANCEVVDTSSLRSSEFSGKGSEQGHGNIDKSRNSAAHDTTGGGPISNVKASLFGVETELSAFEKWTQEQRQERQLDREQAKVREACQHQERMQETHGLGTTLGVAMGHAIGESLRTVMEAMKSTANASRPPAAAYRLIPARGPPRLPSLMPPTVPSPLLPADHQAGGDVTEGVCPKNNMPGGSHSS